MDESLIRSLIPKKLDSDMAGIVPYLIWAALIVSGASLAAMAVYGIRNIAYGKMDYVTAGLLGTPGLLLVVLGFVMDSWAEAAVMTFMILLILTSLSLLISSIRGLLGL